MAPDIALRLRQGRKAPRGSPVLGTCWLHGRDCKAGTECDSLDRWQGPVTSWLVRRQCSNRSCWPRITTLLTSSLCRRPVPCRYLPNIGPYAVDDRPSALAMGFCSD